MAGHQRDFGEGSPWIITVEGLGGGVQRNTDSVILYDWYVVIYITIIYHNLIHNRYTHTDTHSKVASPRRNPTGWIFITVLHVPPPHHRARRERAHEQRCGGRGRVCVVSGVPDERGNLGGATLTVHTGDTYRTDGRSSGVRLTSINCGGVCGGYWADGCDVRPCDMSRDTDGYRGSRLRGGTRRLRGRVHAAHDATDRHGVRWAVTRALIKPLVVVTRAAQRQATGDRRQATATAFRSGRNESHTTYNNINAHTNRNAHARALRT